MRFMDARRLSAAFGPQGARQIRAIAPGDTRWHGPILSPQGSAHFVRIAQRNAPQVPDFDVARDWIGTQWLAVQARAHGRGIGANAAELPHHN